MFRRQHMHSSECCHCLSQWKVRKWHKYRRSSHRFVQFRMTPGMDLGRAHTSPNEYHTWKSSELLYNCICIWGICYFDTNRNLFFLQRFWTHFQSRTVRKQTRDSTEGYSKRKKSRKLRQVLGETVSQLKHMSFPQRDGAICVKG